MLLRKRTGNDIWRNLYELPLIEADHQLSVDELLLAPELEGLGANVKPVVRPLQIGVKHVLSHQIIHADFYEMIFLLIFKVFRIIYALNKENGNTMLCRGSSISSWKICVKVL